MDFEFLGPYRIEGVLGRGGMGTVFKGVHAKTGEAVAVKVIASVLADQERFRRRFDAEVETLKRLRHPNIVQLIGYGEEQGHLFYSMEFVDGQTLQDQLRSEGKIGWMRVLDVCIEVSAALKQAHDLGIIHRDLKPANLMIASSGQVKLTDFGIAKLFGSTDMTAIGAVLGTADFMPPEQAEGKPVTARSDLYAIGSIAYAALTGRAPFVGRSVPEVLYSVRYQTPDPIHSMAPDAPEEIVQLVEELMNKDPLLRPPTALVVGNRLQAIRVGLKRRMERLANPTVEKAANSSELTSIEFDSINVKPETFLNAEDSATHVRPMSSNQGKPDPLADGQTQAPEYAGPEDVTKVGTPSLMESDFIENTSAERAAGQTRFTVVEERERRASRSSILIQDSSSHWLHVTSIVVLSLLLVGCIVALWVFTRPLNADKLYERIITALDSGDDSMLVDAEPWLDDMMERFPDDLRIDELTVIQKDIRLIRLGRLLTRKSRTGDGKMGLDPIEQAFLDCFQLRLQNPADAILHINSLISVYGKDASLSRKHQEMLELAMHLRDQLKRLPQEKSDNTGLQELQEQLQRAATEMAPEQRTEFYRGLITLYQDKAWAKPVVEQAKLALEAIQ